MSERKILHTPPLVHAMLIANDVQRDPTTGKHSILGVYDVLHASRFPWSRPVLCVYLALMNGHGKTPVTLRLVDVDETMAPVFQAENVIPFAEPNRTVEVAFRYATPIFSVPGEYRLQLFAAGELLAERRLYVGQPASWQLASAPLGVDR